MTNAICESCQVEYSMERKDAGYDTCLECGDLHAKHEIEERSLRVGVGYNKGGLQLLGSDDNRFKDAMLDAGAKTRRGGLKAGDLPISALQIAVSSPSGKSNLVRYHQMASRAVKPKPKKHKIGVYWIGADKFTLWSDQDPEKLGATRWALL